MSDWVEKDPKDLKKGCWFVSLFTLGFWGSVVWVFLHFISA